MKVLLTGATGGLGAAVARALVSKDLEIAIVGRSAQALNDLANELREQGCFVQLIKADIASPDERTRVIETAFQRLGGIDVLINLAGVNCFAPVELHDDEQLERLLTLNLLAPMSLTRQVVPAMRAQGHGHIVNVGSVLGTIGFPYFTGYSASKFGLRGFSEALRRELAGTGIAVSYVAPRAVDTPMNTVRMHRMAQATHMAMDTPELVAARIVEAIAKRQRTRYVGFPESLFVRINALLPGIVDRALRKQSSAMAPFARQPD